MISGLKVEFKSSRHSLEPAMNGTLIEHLNQVLIEHILHFIEHKSFLKKNIIPNQQFTVLYSSNLLLNLLHMNIIMIVRSRKAFNKL